MMNNNNKVVGKFRFNLMEDICYWIKEDSDYQVPKQNQGQGKIANQKYFALEGEVNPSHWVNYTITYSGGKVWLTVWYKKFVGETRNDYKIRVVKTGDIMEVELKESDEMVKMFDEKKNKDKWIKKTLVENDNRVQI